MAAPLHTLPYNPKAPAALGHAAAVTKSDSTVYSPPLIALWVGGTGDIAIKLQGDDTAVTIPAVPAGWWAPAPGLAIKQVMSTNTSATGLIGFW